MRGLSFGELWITRGRKQSLARLLQATSGRPGPAVRHRRDKDSARVVLHIVAVQMRYAERLLNMPITEYDTLGRARAVKRTVRALAQKFGRPAQLRHRRQ